MNTVAPVETIDFPARAREPLRLGNVTLPARFTLAPLAGYTTLAFRLAVRELGGVGLATTDLVNARALRRKKQNRRTLELIQTDPADRPVAVQIYGADTDDLCAAAQFLAARGATVIDINMGCPVHKVNRGGSGSAMMCNPDATVDLVHRVVQSVQVPVTVKMRLGWDEDSLSAPYFARRFQEAGVAGLIIHGRTRAQGFTGSVQLEGIRAVVEAASGIPVIGNGDVHTPADAAHMMRVTGCAGVAIGRGALLDPWIFIRIERLLRAGEPGPAPTYEQRVSFMERHLHLLASQRGDRYGCIVFRKVANWYCRVLRPGREIQQRLVRLESPAEFDAIVAELRANAPANWQDHQPTIAVPSGPISHW